MVGEYLALAGGPAVVLTTEPSFRFTWEIEKSGDGRASIRHPLHQDSPAGRWLNQAESVVPDGMTLTVSVEDPNRSKNGALGGFGSSTAEFFGAWVMTRWMKNRDWWRPEQRFVANRHDHRNRVVPEWPSEEIENHKFGELLRDYKSVTPHGSGADLLAQATGEVAIWTESEGEMRRYGWPFTDIAYTLLRTGKKLATHSHVANFDRQNEAEFLGELEPWVDEAVHAIAIADSDRLVASVRGVAQVLDRAGRVAEHTKAVLEEVDEIQGVRAAKGCGAMGADVILVLHEATDVAANALATFAESRGLEYGPSQISSGPKLSSGVNR